MVVEADLIKADMPMTNIELRRCWSIFDFAAQFHQVKHIFDIGHGSFNLPVNKTKKVKRHKELHHKGINQYKVTDGHAALSDSLGG